MIRGLLPVLVLLTGWQLVGDPASVTLPPPTAWFDALAGLHRAGELWPAVGSTLHSTTAAVRAIPPTRIDAARSLGLRVYHRWTRVLLPSLVPQLFVALRVTSALTLIITLLTDILGTDTGIGRLLVVSQQRFESAACWGLLLVVGAIGCLASAVLAQIDARLAPARRWDGKHFG